MKKSSLQRIEELIPLLPDKDAKLASKYLKERNFQYILELVESDIYKENKEIEEDEYPNEYISRLTELKGELLLYMSYLDISDNFNDYDYY